MNESKVFISVGIDMQEVRNILSRLDQDKREKALKDALKQTAEKARKKDTEKGKAGTAVRHIAVAQRKGEKRLVINEKFSNSIPVMLGSEKRVYGLVEPYIAGDLQDNLRKIVDAAIGGR